MSIVPLVTENQSICIYNGIVHSFDATTRGGIMFWADSIGAKYIHAKLEEWTKQYDSFFKPCSYLAQRARAAKGIPLVRKSLFS
jgi:hypothetical protein